MAEARRLTQVRTKRSGLVASSHLAGSFFPACFMFKCVAKRRFFWARQSLSKCLSAVYGPANSLPKNQIVHCSLLLYKYFIQGRNNCLFLEEDIFISYQNIGRVVKYAGNFKTNKLDICTEQQSRPPTLSRHSKHWLIWRIDVASAELLVDKRNRNWIIRIYPQILFDSF